MNGWVIQQTDSFMNDFWESVEGTVGSVNDVPHFQPTAKQSLSLARFRTVILKIPDISQHFCYFGCGILRTSHLSWSSTHSTRTGVPDDVC